jgi:hypothetical protein
MPRVNSLSDRDTLVDLALISTKDVIDKLKNLKDSDHKFKKTTARKFSEHEGTQPTFRKIESSSYKDGYDDFGSIFAFREQWEAKYRYTDIEGFTEILEFARQREDLLRFLNLNSDDNGRPHLVEISVGELLTTAAAQYIFDNDWELEVDKLRAIVEKLVNWWVLPDVPIELVVPILNVSFEVDNFDLDNSTRVERMSDGLRLSCWPSRPRVNDHETVQRMATHAVILSHWTLPNPSALGWMFTTKDEPLDAPTLDRFFQALSTIIPEPSGYLQVVYRPLGWSHTFSGPLPEIIQGPIIPQHSSKIEGTDEPERTLSTDETSLVQQAFTALQSNEKTISIAGQRLWEAERRTSDVDRIIDLCIGIEALVSGEAPGDTTYKISVRTAAVLADLGINDPKEVMKAAKTVYALRSAVVHGREKPSAAEVTLGGETMNTIDAARYFLRNLLRARLCTPELTPDQIDARIIGGALALWQHTNTDRSANESTT